MLTTRFTQLVGCSVPIQMAAIGSLTNPELVSAVSNAGGMGSLPCAMLGPDAMRKELAAITSQTRRFMQCKLLLPCPA